MMSHPIAHQQRKARIDALGWLMAGAIWLGYFVLVVFVLDMPW